MAVFPAIWYAFSYILSSFFVSPPDDFELAHVWTNYGGRVRQVASTLFSGGGGGAENLAEKSEKKQTLIKKILPEENGAPYSFY